MTATMAPGTGPSHMPARMTGMLSKLMRRVSLAWMLRKRAEMICMATSAAIMTRLRVVSSLPLLGVVVFSGLLVRSIFAFLLKIPPRRADV